MTAIALALTVAGCKDTESLVVVTLSAEASDPTAKNMTSVVLSITDGTHSAAQTVGLTSLVVTCAGASRTFELTAPLKLTRRHPS